MPGSAFFVMDEDGRIFISTEELEEGVLHHSSLIGGRRVAAAGQVEVYHGLIIRITDKSGVKMSEVGLIFYDQ